MQSSSKDRALADEQIVRLCLVALFEAAAIIANRSPSTPRSAAEIALDRADALLEAAKK